jgi:hypothetical protein
MGLYQETFLLEDLVDQNNQPETFQFGMSANKDGIRASAGSYRLKILLEPGGYSIDTHPSVSSASEIYINGELVAKMEPSRKPKQLTNQLTGRGPAIPWDEASLISSSTMPISIIHLKASRN